MAAVAISLAACARTPPVPGTTTGAALPSGGYYKVGKPYQVNGIWYYPAEDYNYDETGIASWYGPGFHQERTANGETFDQNDVTAAHKTLPMPTLVRVTNLENGRSLVVRINDRGPFVAGRIIDLSRRSAQLLGMEGKGTAKVRVTVLAEESRAIAAAARSGQPYAGSAPGVAVAAASPDGGPVPMAAPRMSVQVEGQAAAPAKAAVERPPVVESVSNVPGQVRDGRFLPAAEVRTVAVTGSKQLYVQAGAFTVHENAQRLRTKVAGIGPASVKPTQIGDTQYYRVRVGPIDTVERADAVLNQVIAAGAASARIIVD